MKGKTLLILFAIFLLAFASVLYYSINYWHYTTTSSDQYTFQTSGQPITLENYKKIDATSSPIKYRACGTVISGDVSVFPLADEAHTPTPLVAPSWFKCFDAKKIGDDLASGIGSAYVISQNEPYGVTEYMVYYKTSKIAVFWRQLNACGEAQFSGKNPPNYCPQFGQ